MTFSKKRFFRGGQSGKSLDTVHPEIFFKVISCLYEVDGIHVR